MSDMKPYAEILFGNWRELATVAQAAFAAPPYGLEELIEDLLEAFDGESILHTALLRTISADVGKILNEPFNTALELIGEARRLNRRGTSGEYLQQAQFSLMRALGIASDKRQQSITGFFVALTWVMREDTASALHWRDRSFADGREWLHERVRASNGLIMDLSDDYDSAEFGKMRNPMSMAFRRGVVPVDARQADELEAFVRFYNMVRLSRHATGDTFRGLRFEPTHARGFGEPSHVLSMTSPLIIP